MRFSQGGGIGLEPVYAVDALYKENSTSHITADATGATGNTATATKWKLTVIDSGLKIGGIDLGLTNTNAITIGSNTITATDVGSWKSVYSTVGDNNTNGTLAYNTQKISYNATTGTTVDGKFTVNGAGAGIYVEDNAGNHVQITSSDVIASNSVHATNTIASGINARMEGGKVVAQNGLYIGYTSDQITDASYDNSRFAVNGENGSFKAADGKFEVSNSGAITADSLKLTGKDGTENVGTAIKTNAGNIEINKNSIDTLNGKVNGHDTEINTLKTKTEGITRVDCNSTTVDGVNFKEGAVVAAGVAANSITANNFVTVGDTTNGYVHMTKEGIAVSGRLYSSLETGAASVSVAEMANTRDNTQKISYTANGTKIDSDVIINAGEKNQVKITKEEGIVVGLNSSVVNDDGVFAGGHKYNNAKAALNASDGSIKGANGAFGVDKDGALKAANEKFAVDKDGNVTTEGNIQGNNITATGVLNGASLDVTGNATVGGTLDVTGKTTLKNELQVNETATFGIASGSQTFINGDEVKTGRIETTKTQSSYIGGVTLHNGQITADSMTINGNIDLKNLNVKETLTVGTFGVTKAGVVIGVTSINSVDVSNQGAGLQIGSATVGDSNPFSSQGYTVDATGNVSAKDITAGKYNGNEITADKKFNGVELNGGNVKATKVTADTITDGNGFTATGGNVTAKSIHAETGNIAGVSFAAGGNVSGITELTATTIKDGAGTIITGGNVESKTAKIGAIKIENETIEGSSANGLSIEGVKIKDGVMSSVVSIDAAKATIGGVNTLDNTGLTVKTGSKVQVGTNTVIEDGSVKVSQKTSLTDQSLQLNDTNKWTQTGGLVADKATVNGIALGTDSQGKATFSDAAGNTTTIDGNKITTGTITADKLLIDKISLGKDGNDNISIDKNGDVTTKGEIRITDAAGHVMTKLAKDSATFGKDVANQTVIENGKLNAKAEASDHQQAELKFDENGLTVSGQNAAGQKSSFSFNAKTGDNTFTGQDSTTTTINGSVITSTKAAGNTGVLDGSKLTLTNGDNKTEMTAGGATFTKDGKTTIISGDTITTGTLNVTDIVLGGTMYDTAGKPLDGKLSIGNDGHLRAANGNFDVKDDGTFKNTVGNTTLQTGTTGASMKFNNTAADGGVTSEVAVEANKATVAAGDKASFVANADNGGSATITGGTQTVTTTDKGTEFKNSAHNTPFEGGNATTTIINGNEITTGKITTDQLVITGKGNADGNGGSIAFGGNGTIKSDINDGTTNGKNTSFETTLDGVNTKVTNGTTTTENNVSAAGNRNTVTKNDTHKSEFKQVLTSIGGVVTNGEIKVAQKLDGETGLLTNEVTDANGSSKLEQSGTGLTYTDSAKHDNATRIDSSDVSIGSATDDSKRINLSDLGQIDKLDKELTDRDEYKNNPTAVGGINAEAAIRREEVARLDGRINDVNDRVNKVGAMAAAIASLKSIGYDPQAPSEFSIGLGQYKGETGVAMGFFHYPNKNFMINVSLSTAGGETMGGIGATWRFGHKSPQKLLEEQREEQAKKELAAAEKYQAAAKLAKEAQERAEYAAKLARQAQVSADNAKAAADATQAKHFG